MKTIRIAAVILVNSGGKLLIMKRSSDKEVHANLWNLPSGSVKKYESLETAGARETFEETGIKIEKLETGPSLIVKVSEDTQLEVNYLLGRTDKKEVRLDWESSEYKWVTSKESLGYEFAIPKDQVEKILKDFKLL